MAEIEQTDRTIRHRILNAIEQTFEAVNEADHGLKFSTVALGPLGAVDSRKQYVLGIVPQQEQYRQSYPLMERTLNVAVEFRVTLNRGDEKPGDAYEILLGVVENVIVANDTWGGLAIKTDLSNSDQDLTTYEDKSVTGVIFFKVLYRHGTNDNRNPHPSYS